MESPLVAAVTLIAASIPKSLQLLVQLSGLVKRTSMVPLNANSPPIGQNGLWMNIEET